MGTRPVSERCQCLTDSYERRLCLNDNPVLDYDNHHNAIFRCNNNYIIIHISGLLLELDSLWFYYYF
jgi:hypothetical protein